ncbi:hypothetical protein CTAYLR_006774 [Chrysophaeum taylorii]|uniref:tRNA (guanine(26)-N(2))-dimethyltransferase n=1 Tax=Chrysophaeum taylorii TaxID=2483200 RepID=A0AAD7XK96_9STRA|nr:hypothetical protein CTAYLR_006774 [Chrysophaeum taylorii]
MTDAVKIDEPVVAAPAAVATPAAEDVAHRAAKHHQQQQQQQRGKRQGKERKYQAITEGSATMSYELRGDDTRTKGKNDDDGPVFYNRVQTFNRDLSILMMSLFAQWRYIERAEARARKGLRGEAADEAARAERDKLYALSAAELDDCLRADAKTDGFCILDALAATGLRSIRYAKEVPGVRRVVANDLDADAAEACKRNLDANGVEASQCETKCGDAVIAMLEARAGGPGRVSYDVIDIDPYGTCAPFLDAAVQCVSDGGLLCITSTDMTVLSGNYPEVCYARYGSMPTKAKHLHEFALRIIVNAIETSAARYQRHILPVLSVSVDFYVRVFVRVYRRPIEVKKSCLKRAYVLQSTGCPSFYIQPLGRKSPKGDKFGAALVHVKKDATLAINSSTSAAARRRKKRNEADDDAAERQQEQQGEAHNDDDDAAEQHQEQGGGVSPGDAAPAAAAEAEVVASSAAVDASDEVKADDDDLDVVPKFCGETGAPFKIGGPIWIEPLHAKDWVTAAIDRVEAGVDKYLSTTERLHGVLTAISEELSDVPLYYTLPDMCSTLHCSSPKLAEVKAALTHAGYQVSQSHRDPDAVKTNAPPRIIWDIMRCWCRRHPVNERRLADTETAASKILSVEPKLNANFSTTLAMRTKATKARRWAPNPEENWGPKAAARGRKRPRHY